MERKFTQMEVNIKVNGKKIYINGYGKMVFGTGSLYEGEWLEGIKSGKGYIRIQRWK